MLKSPKLRNLFVGMGMVSLFTLGASLNHYFANPLVYSTPLEGFMLGFVPTLAINAVLVGAFFIKNRLNKNKQDAVVSEVLIPTEELETDLNSEELTSESNLEIEAQPEPEIESKQVESELILENPEDQAEKERLLTLTAELLADESSSTSDTEEIHPIELDIEDEAPKLTKPKELKKVTFAEPLFTVEYIKIKVPLEKEKTEEIEINTLLEEKKEEPELVPVKIEPEEPAPVVFHPQHDAQRAQTRQRRAQANIAKNHDADSILPEGTTRNRKTVDRYAGARFNR